MTETEKLQAAVNIIAAQRNAALNDVVSLQVELAALQKELNAAKAVKADDTNQN